MATDAGAQVVASPPHPLAFDEMVPWASPPETRPPERIADLDVTGVDGSYAGDA